MSRWNSSQKPVDDSTSSAAPPVVTDTLRIDAMGGGYAARVIAQVRAEAAAQREEHPPKVPTQPPAYRPRRPISMPPAPTLLHARRGTFSGSHEVETTWRWSSLFVAAVLLLGIAFGVRTLVVSTADGAHPLHRAPRKAVVTAAHAYVSAIPPFAPL